MYAYSVYSIFYLFIYLSKYIATINSLVIATTGLWKLLQTSAFGIQNLNILTLYFSSAEATIKPLVSLVISGRAWHIVLWQYIFVYIYIYIYIYIHIYIFKRSKWGRPGAVHESHLWDLPGTKWWDVLETSSGRWPYMFFKSNSKTY